MAITFLLCPGASIVLKLTLQVSTNTDPFSGGLQDVECGPSCIYECRLVCMNSQHTGTVLHTCN